MDSERLNLVNMSAGNVIGFPFCCSLKESSLLWYAKMQLGVCNINPWLEISKDIPACIPFLC